MKKTLAALVAAAALAVIPATSASAVSQYGTSAEADTAYVQELYGDFLGRDVAADDGGVRYWVARLQNGDSRESVVRAITRSAEYARLYTTVLYQAELNREPDSGARYWVDGIRQGMAPEWVEQNVLASPEFATLEGSDRVDAWYADILGRDNDVNGGAAKSGEEAYWNGVARSQGSLAAVRGIWYSNEAVEFRIDANISGLLNGRPAQSYETDYFYGPEIRSDIETQIEIASTAEYFNATQPVVVTNP